jgi:hypothetical protein
LALGAIIDLSRSKADLIVENALLRQQLIVLHRQIKRPQLTNGDRIRLVWLARFSKFWHQALHIIQPGHFTDHDGLDVRLKLDLPYPAVT